MGFVAQTVTPSPSDESKLDPVEMTRTAKILVHALEATSFYGDLVTDYVGDSRLPASTQQWNEFASKVELLIKMRHWCRLEFPEEFAEGRG